MTLQEFLSLMSDEEVRIELEIDVYDEEEYLYTSFWLSDFRTELDTNKYYKDWAVVSFSFENIFDRTAQITIMIEK